jgi:hypothetical protein
MTVDLFGLGNTFRAMSPFQQAVNLAHRAARQRLETGGTAAPAAKPAKPDPAPAAFVVPRDVDPDEVAKAIEAKLREQGAALDQPVLQRRAGGRVVVPAAIVLRLGGGKIEVGRRFVQGVVNQIRARRKTGK